MNSAGIEPAQRSPRRLWAIVALAVVFGIVVLGGGIFVGVLGVIKHSEAFQLAVTRLQASPVAADALGAPISAGTPYGSINTSGDSGTAQLNFSVTGSKAKGEVFVDAVKRFGTWSIRELTLKVDGSDREINLIAGAT